MLILFPDNPLPTAFVYDSQTVKTSSPHAVSSGGIFVKSLLLKKLSSPLETVDLAIFGAYSAIQPNAGLPPSGTNLSRSYTAESGVIVRAVFSSSASSEFSRLVRRPCQITPNVTGSKPSKDNMRNCGRHSVLGTRTVTPMP